jgi:glycosyltransferase involved in cell wall biosynthesis
MGVKQGLDNVVSAAKIAEERNQPISFIMLGAGNQIEGLKDLAGNCSNITFVAPVSDEELSGYLNSADVLLVNERPGVREMSVPSKLTTYFQTGKPVLVCSEPDSLAAREVLGNEIGFWTRSGNPEGLLKALLDLDLKKGTDIALAAKLHADRHLSKEAALRSFKSTIDLA